jgi:predicted amidohydrolase
MTPRRAIAVAQTVPVRGDVTANLAEHLVLARLAADHGAEVVVFPELSLTGYELDLAATLSFAENDARLAPLSAVAKERGLTLIAGAPVRLGAALHIGAFVLLPDGRGDLYTKHHLGTFPPSAAVDGTVPPGEPTVFEPGSRDPLLELGGRPAAIAVCADTGSASHPARAAACGGKTYLASMFVIPSEFEAETANLRSHARSHSLLVAAANFGGPSGGLASAGRSAIWSEQGELLGELGEHGAGVLVATEHESGFRTKTLGRVSPRRFT